MPKSCAPCPHKTKKSEQEYFYVENTSETSTPPRTTKRRSVSSTGSVKSYSCGKTVKEKTFVKNQQPKCSNAKCPKKLAAQKCRSEETKDKLLDPSSVNQLKNDLKLIKQQLFSMAKTEPNISDKVTGLVAKTKEQKAEIDKLRTENAQFASKQNEINDLKEGFSKLAKINEQQSDEIRQLKLKNQTLKESIQMQHDLDENTASSLLFTKNSLEECERKLCTIYTELINSSKDEIMKVQHALAEKDTEIETVHRNLEETKQMEQKYLQENEKLSQQIQQLEVSLTEAMEKMRDMQNESENRCHDFDELKQNYLLQLEEKSNLLDMLTGEVERLQAHVTECREKTIEFTGLESDYQKLKDEHESLVKELQGSSNVLDVKTKEMEELSENYKKMQTECLSLNDFAHELKQLVKENDAKMSELVKLLKQKDEYIESLQKQIIIKDKKIQMLEHELEESKKEEPTNNTLQLCQMKNINECLGGINLADELQNLINALYEEIDSTLAKDDQIEKQYQNICCLECKLTAKEKELYNLRKELQLMHKQFTKVVQEKAELVKQLEVMELVEYESSDCDC